MNKPISGDAGRVLQALEQRPGVSTAQALAGQLDMEQRRVQQALNLLVCTGDVRATRRGYSPAPAVAEKTRT